jgi:hypothetical protein
MYSMKRTNRMAGSSSPSKRLGRYTAVKYGDRLSAYTKGLQFASRGHIRKLSISSKSFTVIWTRYTTFIFARSTREPAHNNGCNPLPWKGWRPMAYTNGHSLRCHYAWRRMRLPVIIVKRPSPYRAVNNPSRLYKPVS